MDKTLLITVTLSNGVTSRHAISGFRATIGRDAGCDVTIASRSVSRSHARLILGEDGTWRIVDAGSKNGIWVNGRRIQEAELKLGVEVSVGDARLRVATDDETQTQYTDQFWMDDDTQTLRRGEVTIGAHLTPLEFRLLKLLMDNGGHLVRQRTLETRIWGDDGYDDNALHQLVSRVRRKIGDRGTLSRFLVTEAGSGYRLNLDSELGL